MLKLIPECKDYIWGGTKLKEKYNKKCDLEKLAETWELSTHPSGLTKIENSNKTLLDYILENGKKILGTKSFTEKDIPILIKFIDAKEALSIQVHPDNNFAKKNENDFGKTEMWYIIEADENAKLIYGFNKDITKEEFEKRIKDNTLTEVINEVSVKQGDVFFLKPGTMHAIGKGIVIAEIQQCSNVTYRIYDFGRVGIDGKPRELHIEKALQVTNLNKSLQAKVNYTTERFENYEKSILSKCEYFNVELYKINNTIKLKATEETFNSILVLDGECKIYNEEKYIYCKKGDSIFIPANFGEYSIEGNTKIILTTL